MFQKSLYRSLLAAGAIVTGLTLFSGSSSAYALINLNTGSSSSVEVETNASLDTSLDADLNTGSNSVDSNGGASVNSNTQVEVNENSSESQSSPRESSIMMEADMLLDGEVLNISRSSINSSDDESSEIEGEASLGNESRVSVSSASDVSTNADLESYAKFIVKSDDRVDALNFTGDMVEVKYKEEGRFLALIPLTFTATAKAYADGHIEVDYPWYSVLTVDNQDEVEARAKIAVDNALRARAVGSVRAEGEVANPRFTAAESATVASELHTVLSTRLEDSETVE